MKVSYTVLCVCGLLMTGIVCLAKEPVALYGSNATPYDVSSPELAPTKVVLDFYKVLLQDAPPTLEQENAIFTAPSSSGLCGNLIQVQGYDPKSPVLFQLFRKHRELFLPRVNAKQGKPYILLSSPFKFVRNLDEVKGHSPSCYVLAMFDDVSANSHCRRTVVFQIIDQEGTGKIQSDTINFDGFQGPSAYEVFFKMPEPPPNSSR